MIRVYTPARWAGLEEVMETALEEQRVLLTITGIQTDAHGNRQETAAQYEAAYRDDGGCHSFFYTAEGEDAVLYLSPELVRMERGKGGSRPGTRMVFDPALPATVCSYVTPYGTIPMEIRTERIVLMDGCAGRRGADKKGRDRGSSGGNREEAVNEDRERTVRSLRIMGRVKYVLTIEGDDPLNCSVTIKAQQIG